MATDSAAEAKKMKYTNVDVTREGSQIVLPKDMSFDEGIEWLQRKKTEENRVIAVREEVDAFPVDGAYAFWKALSRKYGFASLVPTPGFWRDHPPHMLGVSSGPNSTVQVPWGRIQIPGMVGFLVTQVDQKDGKQIFVIGGEVQQRFKTDVAEIASLTRQIAREESLYRGKAIRASFPELSPHDFSPVSHSPKFIDTSTVKENELIFSKDVATIVQDSLFTPIEKTEECRNYKIPLKRGILLEGPYGTGKTLTANVTAKKCEDNGWTFIYLDSVRNLNRAILFAQQYAPAVIFAEDIDQVLQGGRNDDMNAILNTIDGVDTKGHEIIVTLTTNNIDLIHPAMLRPGRLDAVVPVRPPDAEAVSRLLKLYGRDLIAEGESLENIGEELEGQIPAVLREVMERSKLSAVTRLKAGEKLHLKEVDLLNAAKGVLAQTERVNPDYRAPPHPFEILGKALGREIAFGQIVSKLTDTSLQEHLPPDLQKALQAVTTIASKTTPANGSTKRQ